MPPRKPRPRPAPVIIDPKTLQGHEPIGVVAVSQMTGLSPHTIRNKLSNGDFPAPMKKAKPGSRNLWKVMLIWAWMAKLGYDMSSYPNYPG